MRSVFHDYITSNNIVSQWARVQNNIHTIAVPQEHSMSIATGAKLKVEGVSSIWRVKQIVNPMATTYILFNIHKLTSGGVAVS